mmetsp:Transcript_29909/g.36404  ORF Transcript_29909/g.36404 Transcript_29909/m.36404 type:complete len:250 (+) Transcript_29909:178-927(+)
MVVTLAVSGGVVVVGGGIEDLWDGSIGNDSSLAIHSFHAARRFGPWLFLLYICFHNFLLLILLLQIQFAHVHHRLLGSFPPPPLLAVFQMTEHDEGLGTKVRVGQVHHHGHSHLLQFRKQIREITGLLRGRHSGGGRTFVFVRLDQSPLLEEQHFLDKEEGLRLCPASIGFIPTTGHIRSILARNRVRAGTNDTESTRAQEFTGGTPVMVTFIAAVMRKGGAGAEHSQCWVVEAGWCQSFGCCCCFDGG